MSRVFFQLTSVYVYFVTTFADLERTGCTKLTTNKAINKMNKFAQNYYDCANALYGCYFHSCLICSRFSSIKGSWSLIFWHTLTKTRLSFDSRRRRNPITMSQTTVCVYTCFRPNLLFILYWCLVSACVLTWTEHIDLTLCFTVQIQWRHSQVTFLLSTSRYREIYGILIKMTETYVHTMQMK